MVADPIVVADVVLDAALAAGADAVVIEPAAQPERYTVAVAKNGELIAVSALDAELAVHAIARLGYVSQIDPAATRTTTGRTRVRSVDAQRDVIITIAPGLRPRAELMFVAPGAKAEPREPLPGERVGHYQILCRIGAGGMGDVYEVEHVTLKKRAALKILQQEVIARDDASRDKFLLEAQATARIASPHVVEVYDFGYLADNRPYFVMELLAAQSLGDIMDRGVLPVHVTIAVARQIAAGLVAAHAQGVVHADVTPCNVLVQRDHVKIIDFGLAQLRERRTAVIADHITGTPSYVSPEQLQGHPAVEASDQYALGCVIFEMLAGRPPFDDESTTAICLAHVRTPAPRITTFREDVPHALSAVIARCLQKDPTKRYSSMAALVEALEAVVEAVEA